MTAPLPLVALRELSDEELLAVINKWRRTSNAGRMELGRACIAAARQADPDVVDEVGARHIEPVAAVGGPEFICKKCGADRFREDCKGNLIDCPMLGTATGEGT